ncbi:MAG: NAD(P)/FAD-dependent oxidoreductase [Acidobacteriota bacterium]|nr:NAD(P)/FAD-dependent oxidoreductase [Acidobacteriota bacterium]
MSERFDVIVVGAGPGGMAAAVLAAEAGKNVCLLDENPAPGGQIWRGYERESEALSPHRMEFLRWRRRLSATGCAVWNEARVLAAPQRNMLRVERQSQCIDLSYGKLILATGARERFLPFPGWTLPGVVGAGGLQSFLKSGLDVRGQRVVLAGSGPLLLAVAASLTRAGAHVLLIAEQASRHTLVHLGLHLAKLLPGKLMEGATCRWQTRKTPYRQDAWVVRAEGRERLERVTVRVSGKEEQMECDWLACAYHLVPNLELPLLLGCAVENGAVVVDEQQRSSVEDVLCIGELTGVGGLDKALVEGQIAGNHAAGRTTQAYELVPELRKHRQFVHLLEEAFALRAELRSLAMPETIVCRCEDVTREKLEACDSWRAAKLHTRCGMGSCQGRICGAATEFLYGWDAHSARPPVMPARVSSLAGEEERGS